MWELLSRFCAVMAKRSIWRGQVWVARKEYFEGEITFDELKRRTTKHSN